MYSSHNLSVKAILEFQFTANYLTVLKYWQLRIAKSDTLHHYRTI